MEDSVENNVEDSVENNVEDSVENNVEDSVENSVEDSKVACTDYACWKGFCFNSKERGKGRVRITSPHYPPPRAIIHIK